jgi:MoaA/NifB/PqqE/SkfB family radical SAM enzyme
MYCPNLDHYVRVVITESNSNLFIPCCIMDIRHVKTFTTYSEMIASEWLHDVKDQMKNDIWPIACNKCKTMESVLHPNVSPRLTSITYHNKQNKKDYLVADIMVDNICNAACQTCHPTRSSKLADVMNIKMKVLSKNGYHLLPHDRITKLYLLGGEPGYSKQCAAILKSPPPNLNLIWITTNGSILLDKVLADIDEHIEIQLNISVDGVGKVFEYMRWPLSWDIVSSNIRHYASNKRLNVCLTVTVSSLNLIDLPEIIKFSKEVGITVSWSLLQTPSALSIRKSNKFTLAAKSKFIDIDNKELHSMIDIMAIEENNDKEIMDFITKQDSFRGISYTNFLPL